MTILIGGHVYNKKIGNMYVNVYQIIFLPTAALFIQPLQILHNLAVREV